MSKRQTLSERFENLDPPKHDIPTNERQLSALDDDDSQVDGNTTFTVVNGATSHPTENRNHRISQVTDTSQANLKYGASRVTSDRGFRRELNPTPYFSLQSRPFRTNRYQSQQRTGTNMMSSSRPNINTGYNNNNNNNNGYVSRFNDYNAMNQRGQARGRGWTRQWRGSGMRGGMRGFYATRNSGGRSTVGVGDGNRGRSRGRGGRSRGSMNRGRGDMSKGGKRGALTQEKLDKELDRYYANNDPQKLKEMKNDQLDKELDDYWMAPDESGNKDTTKSEANNKSKKPNNNTSKSAVKNNNESINEKVTDKDF